MPFFSAASTASLIYINETYITKPLAGNQRLAHPKEQAIIDVRTVDQIRDRAMAGRRLRSVFARSSPVPPWAAVRGSSREAEPCRARPVLRDLRRIPQSGSRLPSSEHFPMDGAHDNRHQVNLLRPDRRPKGVGTENA